MQVIYSQYNRSPSGAPWDSANCRYTFHRINNKDFIRTTIARSASGNRSTSVFHTLDANCANWATNFKLVLHYE